MKIKEKLTLENLMYLFVIFCPLLDIISFLFRNYFDTSISPTTLLRPLIPCIVFVILFFKIWSNAEILSVAVIMRLSPLSFNIFSNPFNNISKITQWKFLWKYNK